MIARVQFGSQYSKYKIQETNTLANVNAVDTIGRNTDNSQTIALLQFSRSTDCNISTRAPQ